MLSDFDKGLMLGVAVASVLDMAHPWSSWTAMFLGVAAWLVLIYFIARASRTIFP